MDEGPGEFKRDPEGWESVEQVRRLGEAEDNSLLAICCLRKILCLGRAQLNLKLALCTVGSVERERSTVRAGKTGDH